MWPGSAPPPRFTTSGKLDAEGDPPQARPADRRGIRRDQAPPRRRRRDGGGAGRRRAHPDRPPPPRAPRRRRLSGPARRRRDPARRPDHRGRRHVRRDHLGASLPCRGRHQKAIDILRAEAGTQLDPDAVRAFLAYYAGNAPDGGVGARDRGAPPARRVAERRPRRRGDDVGGQGGRSDGGDGDDRSRGRRRAPSRWCTRPAPTLSPAPAAHRSAAPAAPRPRFAVRPSQPRRRRRASEHAPCAGPPGATSRDMPAVLAHKDRRAGRPPHVVRSPEVTPAIRTKVPPAAAPSAGPSHTTAPAPVATTPAATNTSTAAQQPQERGHSATANHAPRRCEERQRKRRRQRQR